MVWLYLTPLKGESDAPKQETGVYHVALGIVTGSVAPCPTSPGAPRSQDRQGALHPRALHTAGSGAGWSVSGGRFAP